MSLVSLALWADSLPTEAPGGDSPWAPGGDSPWGRRRVRHSLLTNNNKCAGGGVLGRNRKRAKEFIFCVTLLIADSRNGVDYFWHLN